MFKNPNKINKTLSKVKFMQNPEQNNIESSNIKIFVLVITFSFYYLFHIYLFIY